MALRTLALCAGVGGLELGTAVAADVQLVGVVERQAFAAAALVARMEEAALARAPIWDDLATFDGRPWAGAVDLVVAGFPCQPHSLAGRRGGTDDSRWLWPHVWRICREVGARLLFVENVPGLLTSGGLDAVLASLASCGWAAEWLCLPAAAVGAPHRRDRVFLLAADPSRVPVPGLESEWDQRQGGREGAALGRDAQPDDDGAHRAPADAAVARRDDAQNAGAARADEGGIVTGRARRPAGALEPERGGAASADADLLGPEHAGAEPGAAQDDLGRRAAAAARGGDAPADADGQGRRQLGIGDVLEGEWQALGRDADGRGGADAADADGGAGEQGDPLERGLAQGTGAFGRADAGPGPHDGGDDAADAQGQRQPLGWSEPGDDGEELEAAVRGDLEREREEEAEPGVRGSDDGPAAWVDQHPWLAGVPATFERGDPGDVDDVDELNDDWAERIHALGNAVVPAQAAAAWRELWGRLLGA